MSMNKIWICGVGFPVDAKVIRWDEPGGLNATPQRCSIHPRPSQPCPGGGVYPFTMTAKHRRAYRWIPRRAMRGEWNLKAAQAVITQFVLHHDGCPNAQVCYEVLQDERGLSCHFLLDNDGTIYQTLDLGHEAFHAAGFNAHSIGIEMSNRGDAKKYPHYYKHRGTITCRIHDHTYLAYVFTDAQYAALKELGHALAHALPNLPMDYPQDSPGHQAWTVAKNVRQYSGYLGHYHTTLRKWDPGPFDFKKFIEGLRGSRAFPISTGKRGPTVPEDTDALRAAAKKLYRINEQETGAGYFPVGPYGASGLWHGGVHLKTRPKQPVYAPFAGRLLAARMGGSCDIGSTNFVLLRHTLTVGTSSLKFFSLFFHLADEIGHEGRKGAPPWTASKLWKQQRAPNQIALLDEPIQAGQVVGRVGMAGPDQYREPQVHFEIFATEEILGQLNQNTWTVIDGTMGGRTSSHQGVISEIDENKDNKLSRQELADFYGTNPDRRLARYLSVLNVSEWTGDPDWTESLEVSPDFRKLGKSKLKQMVQDQIDPTLWWNNNVAQHAQIPKDGVVYHYHPITFIKFVSEKLLEAKVLANDGLGAFSAASASVTPKGVMDDYEDKTGSSFVSAKELKHVDYGHNLTLEDLAKGFPD